MIKIEFSTGNAAFAYGSAGYETARILRDLANYLEDGLTSERNI